MILASFHRLMKQAIFSENDGVNGVERNDAGGLSRSKAGWSGI